MPERSPDVDVILAGANAHETPRSEEDRPSVGEWYWVTTPDDESRLEWLGCVVHVGSNYAELHGPCDDRSYHSERVHFSHLNSRCRREIGAREVIAGKIAEQREIISQAVRQIGALAGRLQIGGKTTSEARELVAYRGGSMDSYKSDLVKARDEGLPQLRGKIVQASKIMKVWMQAEAVPLEADRQTCERSIALVEKRISAVELYAGLVEESVKVRDGSPAPLEEPVYLFQRRHYMDEECLANYEAGGMSFADLGAFEAWLLRSDNLQRILPYPRCAVAFRVRRCAREHDDSIDDFISILFGQEDDDLKTFLYMRNGEQVHRLETSIDFGEKLFPDVDHQLFAGGGKLYALREFGEIKGLVSENEYLDVLEAEKARDEELTGVTDSVQRWKIEDKYRSKHPSYNYVPWDVESVDYDDVSEYVRSLMEEHNRLVLLLQGLFDRSEVFYPHPPYRMWDSSDFARAVRLCHDDSRALTPGDEPDFEAYRSDLNAHMKRGSYAVGQDNAWARREAARYNEQELRGVRAENKYRHEKSRYRPKDDPGPGVVAQVKSFSPERGCTFVWKRPRRMDRSWSRRAGQLISDRITVPLDELLCVDAYEPGDYKRFYADPRTRAKYLKWAPLLLRAEEYCATKNR